MHRSQTGALASLTANYTDSDASDGGEDNVDVSARLSSATVIESIGSTTVLTGEGHQLHYLPALVNPSPFTVSPAGLFGRTNADDNSQPDMMAVDDAAEMGHITDEDQTDLSDQSEDEIDLKDVLIYADDVTDVQIPPEPTGRCANHLQEKFAQYYERMLREGLDLNATIQNQKQFRNPSIYEKLIQFCQIDELGTNYSPEVYDPGQFQNGPYYEDLAKAQKAEMDKRMKEHKDRTKIEFVTGTAKKTSSASTTADVDEVKRRKSKWDVGATTTASTVGQPPGLVPITSVASGTKAMVISAFGTIAKKSKP